MGVKGTLKIVSTFELLSLMAYAIIDDGGSTSGSGTVRGVGQGTCARKGIFQTHPVSSSYCFGLFEP